MDLSPSATNRRKFGFGVAIDIDIASHYGLSRGEHLRCRHAYWVERSLDGLYELRICGMQRVDIEDAGLLITHREHRVVVPDNFRELAGYRRK